jgi:hypothetical protein
LTLSFSSESSIQDELNRESTADAITIVVNILYMQNPLILSKTVQFQLYAYLFPSIEIRLAIL